MPTFITEKTDCWDVLKNTDLPVFIYGMGDGAVKIMSVFEKYGIPIAGFFASDEFVRGHTFKGHLVHTLSQIEALIDDFVIVLAFAAGYKSLYDRIFQIAKRHTLLAPDVPVAGEGLFTRAYCEKNAVKLQTVYDMLADEKSRQTFADVINFKISGKIEYLDRCTSEERVYGGLIPLSDNEVYVDMGAYNGDTALEFLDACHGNYSRLYAIEPNPKNFRKLTKAVPDDERITLLNAAAWSGAGTTAVTPGDGRMCRVGANQKAVAVPAIAADDVIKEQATLIKLDVEGSEREALLGARRHIEGGAKLICSLYHRNEDIFELPLLIKSMNPNLKFYVRHQLYIPTWETNLYCVDN